MICSMRKKNCSVAMGRDTVSNVYYGYARESGIAGRHHHQCKAHPLEMASTGPFDAELAIRVEYMTIPVGVKNEATAQ